MAENSFRSKHAGLPGSMMAIRVNYGRQTNAFDAPGPETELGRTRSEVRRWAQGHRLGDKHEWNPSSRDDKLMRFPDRPLMHSLSEFQGTRIEYNYRAQTLPSVNKTAVYVPKPSKMEVDKTIFLSSAEKEKLVSRCAGTMTSLSRSEMQNDMPSAAREGGWNISTSLPEERANIFKKPKYPSYLHINKVKDIVDDNSYISPIERQAIIAETMRETKIAQRRTGGKGGAHASSSTSTLSMSSSVANGAPAVFKMSNIGEWWDKCPIPELQDQNTIKGSSSSNGGGGGGASGGGSGVGAANAGASAAAAGGATGSFDGNEDPR